MGEDPTTDVYHDRANHEDGLLIARSDVFINFNGFLAVAVGLVDDQLIKVVFAGVALLVDLAWLAWAPASTKFIRALRDQGKRRADEVLWFQKVGQERNRRWWTNDALRIMTVYIPFLLAVGWFVVLGYLMWRQNEIAGTQSHGSVQSCEMRPRAVQQGDEADEA